TIAPPGGLCPDAHHHLDDVLQALLVHLVRLIHVFDVEAQAVGHHPARIYLPAFLERDHIFDVGGRIATASARGRDDGGLIIHPGPGVHRNDVAALDTEHDNRAKLAYQPEDGVQRVWVSCRFHRDIRPYAAGNLHH